LWYGDILVQYALCGLFVASMRDWEPKELAKTGLLLLSIPVMMTLVQWLSINPGSPALANLAPSEAALASEIATYRSGWLAQFDHRASTAFLLQTGGFVSSTFWRLSGLMLWGMALFKIGVLSNQRSTGFYYRLLVGGLVGGLTLTLTGVWYNTAADWSTREVLFVGSQFNYVGSMLLAGAYIAAVMLYCRRRVSGPVITGLSAVGRTAFSNYLLQTVLATSIFYGHGLGLFGSVSRVEQLGIVVGIWAVQITLSVIWLRYYRFGPVEWLWRTVTYETRQPLRKEKRR